MVNAELFENVDLKKRLKELENFIEDQQNIIIKLDAEIDNIKKNIVQLNVDTSYKFADDVDNIHSVKVIELPVTEIVKFRIDTMTNTDFYVKPVYNVIFESNKQGVARCSNTHLFEIDNINIFEKILDDMFNSLKRELLSKYKNGRLRNS